MFKNPPISTVSPNTKMPNALKKIIILSQKWNYLELFHQIGILRILPCFSSSLHIESTFTNPEVGSKDKTLTLFFCRIDKSFSRTRTSWWVPSTLANIMHHQRTLFNASLNAVFQTSKVFLSGGHKTLFHMTSHYSDFRCMFSLYSDSRGKIALMSAFILSTCSPPCSLSAALCSNKQGIFHTFYVQLTQHGFDLPITCLASYLIFWKWPFEWRQYDDLAKDISERKG